MSTVTSLKQQKNKNRASVYLDGKFTFGIDLDNLVLLNLKIGKDLSEKEVKEIIKKSEFQKTFDKLLKWVTNRPHSEKEINDYFKRKKVPEVVWNDLFSRLRDLDLVNDQKFAEWWVKTRNEFSPKSKKVLENELKVKGVDKNIINKALSEIKIDEKKIAISLLKKRQMHWDSIDLSKRKQKMLYYLMSKGFNFEIAKFATNHYNKNEDGKT